MTDWTNRQEEEQKPCRVCRVWVFEGTRFPLFAIYENLASGATMKEFVEWFLGDEKEQVRTVLEHEAEFVRTSMAVRTR